MSTNGLSHVLHCAHGFGWVHWWTLHTLNTSVWVNLIARPLINQFILNNTIYSMKKITRWSEKIHDYTAALMLKCTECKKCSYQQKAQNAGPTIYTHLLLSCRSLITLDSWRTKSFMLSQRRWLVTVTWLWLSESLAHCCSRLSITSNINRDEKHSTQLTFK